MKISDFVERGLNGVVNDYGETLHTVYDDSYRTSIVFSNGYKASIINKGIDKDLNTIYSVAVCDWNGYFDWEVLQRFGAEKGKENHGCVITTDEDEICRVLTVIEALRD